jgi:hypothetical protein
MLNVCPRVRWSSAILKQQPLSQVRGTSSRAPVEQFTENHDIVEQSVCHVIGAHDKVLNDSIPNLDDEMDLISIFEDSTRIIPCPEVTVVDVEHLDV